MAVNVPTAGDTKRSAKVGIVNGLVGGIGQQVGEGVLGPGLGTAAGGIVAGAALDGTDRDIVSTVAVMNGIARMGAGGGGSTEAVM